MKIVIWRITIHQIRSGQKSINQFVSYGLWALQPVIGTAENLFQDQEHKCFNVLQQNAIFQILTVEREKKVLTVTMKTLIRAGIHELNWSQICEIVVVQSGPNRFRSIDPCLDQLCLQNMRKYE